MAHTRNHRRHRPRRTGTPMRRTLRREVPSTVGLLADEQDFAAMRRYRIFAFDDHTRLSAADGGAAAGRSRPRASTPPSPSSTRRSTRSTARTPGSTPDTPASRSRYTAEVAVRGRHRRLRPASPSTTSYPTPRRRGRPAGHLGVRHGCSSPRSATAPTAGRTSAAPPSTAPPTLLMRLLEAAGPGIHHLVCSARRRHEQLLAVAPRRARRRRGRPTSRRPRALVFGTVLAVGIALDSPGGRRAAHQRPGRPDRVHGWACATADSYPLTAGEVFNAYCTDADTGEPVPPEPGVEYCRGLRTTRRRRPAGRTHR